MHPSQQAQTGFKRQVVFRIGADDWSILEAAAREHGSIQAAVLAGIRALNLAQPAPSTEAPARTTGKTKAAPKQAKRSRQMPAKETIAPLPETAALDPHEEIRARDAAQLLGVKSGTVSGYIRSGRLPGRYDAAPSWRGWLTTRAAIEAYKDRIR